jgi:hypothetical protein
MPNMKNPIAGTDATIRADSPRSFGSLSFGPNTRSRGESHHRALPPQKLNYREADSRMYRRTYDLPPTVFVIMELSTRRNLHRNVTAHPTAEWTAQQFRQALPGGHAYQFVIHDRIEKVAAKLGSIIVVHECSLARTLTRYCSY